MLVLHTGFADLHELQLIMTQILARLIAIETGQAVRLIVVQQRERTGEPVRRPYVKCTELFEDHAGAVCL